MDRVALRRFYRAQLVHRFADHIEHPPKRLLAHRHRDRLAQALGTHAAHEAFSRLKRDRANAALAHVLRDFADDIDRLRYLEPVARDPDGGLDNGNLPFRKLDVHGRSGDLNYFANNHDILF